MSDTPPRDDSAPSGDDQRQVSDRRIQSTDGPSRRAVFRFAALGTELAAYTLVFTGIGYGVDRARGHHKLYATAAGTLLGFTYGMFRFVTEVRRGSGQQK